MIRHVLFDMDDTLCDFAAARRRGLEAAFARLEPPARATAIQHWQAIEPTLYSYFTRRVLSRDGYRRLRFAATLSASRQLGQPRSADAGDPPDLDRIVDEMNRAFMTEVNDRITATAGAADCLRALADTGVSCHVFTNGPLDGQLRKVAVTELASLVDRVFVSEELGVAKPDPEAFRLVLADLGVPADQVVMVGDSPAFDIAPALTAGMHAVLYSPTHPHPERGVVRSLMEIPDALAAL